MRVVIDNYNRFLSGALEQKFAHYLVTDAIKEPEFIVHIGRFTPELAKTRLLDDRYYVKEDYVYCAHKYKIAGWKAEIKGFTRDKTILKIQTNIPGWWVFPGGTIYSLLMYKLAMKGYVMLHASGVSKDGRGYVFTGRSGTGKTITVFNLLRNGFEYLGDDTVILGHDRVLSFIKPLNIRFTYNVRDMLGLDFGGRERIFIWFKKILRFMSAGYINLFTKVNVGDFFPKGLGVCGSIDKLFLMAQGNNFCIEKSDKKEDFAMQMVTNIRFELEELSAYLLAYTFIFPESDTAVFWEDVEKNIRQTIAEKFTYAVEVPKRYRLTDFDLLLKRLC